MEYFIVIGILVIVIGLAVWYIVRSKKSGKKCIGCPDSGCSAKKGGCKGECSCCSSKSK